MHLTARYYDYYQSSAYAQYLQRRNIILGVSLSISILLFLFSLHRFIKKRREKKAAQLGTQTNNVQGNGASQTEPKLDYTLPPHQAGQNSPYPDYTPENNHQNQSYTAYNHGQNQPYPNYTPENNQQNQPYPPNYALPHYNPSFNPNSQAPQGTFPGGFMPQANGQQFGYPQQIYPPENIQPASGASNQPHQYPPSSQPTLNQRAAEAPSSPVEPVKESTK
jgi:hypothetical protein